MPGILQDITFGNRLSSFSLSGFRLLILSIFTRKQFFFPPLSVTVIKESEQTANHKA